MRKSRTVMKKWARRPERPNHNLQHKDLICCNIYCKKPLTEYEFDRQTKSYKYRFCIRCRKLSKKEIDEILGEIYEEQQAGKVVMDEILDRLLTDDKLKGIESGRNERFTKRPFDIFFFADEEFK